MITLTDEQQAAVEAVRQWHERAHTACGGPVRPFRLFGPAGTGKTTLARYIANALDLERVVFGAYTGKAAQVLQRKGVDASTIHSAIYRPTQSAELRAKLWDLQDRRADLAAQPVQGAHADYIHDIAELDEQISQVERELAKPFFQLNPDSEWGYADLIVLDEVSMVDDAMAEDIESFGVPVLVLGDPAQLPPVGGGGHYTRDTPDVLLDQIHRQALESPVLELATRIRMSRDATLGVRDGEHETASVSRAMAAEQVLCWRNATRWKLTDRIRTKLERPAGQIVAGDRIICLVNNKKDLGVLNGQQFDVLEVKDDWHLRLRETGTADERWTEVWPDGFQGLAGEAELKNRRAFRGPLMAATYANVITVHKFQGSEAESVYVIDETPAMQAMHAAKHSEAMGIAEARRWLYTAVTRARETVTLARLRG